MVRPRRQQILNARTRLQNARMRTRGAQRAGGRRGPAPSPWDSRAEREAGDARFGQATGSADLNADWQARQEQYGLGANAGSNPYSDANMLERQRTEGQRGVLTGAGNQLYAGSTVNARRGVDDAYAQSRKGLEDSFAADQMAFNRGQRDVGRDFESGMAAIKEGALERALESKAPAMNAGRGGFRGPRVRERQNISRPRQAQILNAKARRLNARATQTNRRR